MPCSMEDLSGCEYHNWEPDPRSEVCDSIENELNRKTGYPRELI